MTGLQNYTQYIEEHLQQLFPKKKPVLLYEPLRYFLTIGGKRMRPIATLLGAEVFGVNREEVIHAALAIEVFHNFSLIHDDIMDAAPLRRGRETVHTKWNDNVAILGGDVMLIESYHQLLLQGGDITAYLDLFNRTAVEVCEGQQLDMDFEQESVVSEEEYLEMIRLKTSVLLGCAFEFGAIAAGVSEEDRKHIYDFGMFTGIAFQIQDDILDVYGDPEKFGKQVGGDILKDKKTLLYLSALSKANVEQRETFERLKAEIDPIKKVTETRALFTTMGIRSYCEEKRNAYYAKAVNAVQALNVPEEKKNILFTLGDYLLNREV